MIRELIKDPAKRFSYVEMKFFTLWFYEQTPAMQTQVRTLVQQGRLEFLNAGWSMSDEACPHFDDFINNMQHGHDFLMKEFGVRPRVAWHIDPFGHSSATPRLFADMGFDAWFFARLDDQDKLVRMEEVSMEWVWRPFFQHEGKRTQIFTHALYQHYSAPSSFDFDTMNEDAPIVDDPTLETYNLDERVATLRDWLDH